LIKGFRFYLELTGVIQKGDKYPRIKAFENSEHTNEKVQNKNENVEFIATLWGPNSANWELQKQILFWSLAHKWEAFWISGIPKNNPWIVLLSGDHCFKSFLRFFKQDPYINCDTLLIAPENQLAEVPKYFVEWCKLCKNSHSDTLDSIKNTRAQLKEERKKTPYLTRVWKRYILNLVYCEDKK